MQLIQAHECFDDVDDNTRTHYVQAITRQENTFYIVRWKECTLQLRGFEQLSACEELQIDSGGPIVSKAWTVTRADADGTYVKIPRLCQYATNYKLDERLLREIDMWEMLKQYPHPHLAHYRGCAVTNRRVSGLCFKRYKSTLEQMVNPKHLDKQDFLLHGWSQLDESVRNSLRQPLKKGLADLWGAVEHLHWLGFVHNDITPANIMLDDDGSLVLIDLDSCRREGESLIETDVKRTPGWHDPGVTMATKQNDYSAFIEIQTWLYGTMVEQLIWK